MSYFADRVYHFLKKVYEKKTFFATQKLIINYHEAGVESILVKKTPEKCDSFYKLILVDEKLSTFYTIVSKMLLILNIYIIH